MDHLFMEVPIEAIHGYVREAGRYLARIHSIVPEGYGYLGADGKGAVDSPAVELAKVHPKDTEQIEQARRIGIDPDMVIRAKEIIIDHSDALRGAPIRVVHGDYGGKHFIVDQGVIKGIVDFERCSAMDPAFDFAWWHYWYEQSVPTKVLLEGYAEEAKLDDDLELRMRLNKLSLALGFMGHVAESNHPGSESVERNLTEDLDWFASRE